MRVIRLEADGEIVLVKTCKQGDLHNQPMSKENCSHSRGIAVMQHYYRARRRREAKPLQSSKCSKETKRRDLINLLTHTASSHRHRS